MRTQCVKHITLTFLHGNIMIGSIEHKQGLPDGCDFEHFLPGSGIMKVWIYSHVLSDYRRVLDWWLDLLSTHTARDYSLQITITLRPVFSVTLLPTADFPLFPGSRPRRLPTISRQPHTLTADCRLTGLVQVAFLYSLGTDRIENTASNSSSIVTSWFVA
jgi:hypothetical protein